VSDVARDGEWIATEYVMMNDSMGFIDMEVEEFVETPVVSGESPVDGSVGVSISLSSLGFDLVDYQGESMSWSVETSSNIGSGSGSVVGYGSVSVPVSGLIGDTSYLWFVNVTDGSNMINRSFGFMTESDRPVVTSPSPGDDAMGVSVDPVLSADVVDLQGESVEWRIMSNASGSWSVLESGTLGSGSGTISASPSDMDVYGTWYWWSVNVTDPLGSVLWRNVTYSFRTTDKMVVSDPGPGDGESWVSLNPLLSIEVLDLHGDPVSVTFRTNASGVWRDIGVVSGDSGVFEMKGRWMLDRSNVRYWWSVNVSDGLGFRLCIGAAFG